MSEIVGIKFGQTGKTYCFKAEGMEVKKGERVVVESEMGISIGRVVRTNCTLNPPDLELKPVLRKVTEADIKQEEENDEVKAEAFAYCRERIMARGLPMKLLTADVTLDRRRFIFYFVADARIDFRELVKDLASKFRTRIELRQIGVRDAAKMLGGFGICGQELCCRMFLKSFAPISIKMAKQQDLVLNTCKLSGACGRLMCCLGYEYAPGRAPRAARDRKAEPAPDEATFPAGDFDSAEKMSVPEEKTPEPAAVAVEEAPAPLKRAATGPEKEEGKPNPLKKRRRHRRRPRRRKKKQ